MDSFHSLSLKMYFSYHIFSISLSLFFFAVWMYFIAIFIISLSVLIKPLFHKYTYICLQLHNQGAMVISLLHKGDAVERELFETPSFSLMYPTFTIWWRINDVWTSHSLVNPWNPVLKMLLFIVIRKRRSKKPLSHIFKTHYKQMPLISLFP